MSYPDSVRYLYALGNEIKAGAKLGLERMQALLAAMHHPEQGRRFVHVAGTNGKGSTCAMIASVLRHGGLRTGLYTSPHLIEPTERINIDGQAVSAELFAEAFTHVHEVAEAMLAADKLDAHPSYFETVTAMALLLFKDRCDISVMEVGLGGRLDATNVIQPELCVITRIDYDHEAYLGNTLEAIAAEKAGILKAGIPVVMAAQPDPAREVIERRAQDLGCPLIDAGNGHTVILELSAEGSRFSLEGDEFVCPLPGAHQIENARAAIYACRALGLRTETIRAGLLATRWPGRLERVAQQPDFILDGAHNPSGAAALQNYIETFCLGRPLWLVYGAMRDKAIEEVCERLFPLADKIIATAPNFPRALRPQAIAEMAHGKPVEVAETLREAIAIARRAPPNARVIFTGSLYLVGEARALLVR